MPKADTPAEKPVVVLDIDGTLVDTNYQHAIAWHRALRDHGYAVQLWEIHRHIGMGGDQIVAALVGDSTWDVKVAEAAGVPTLAVLTGGFSEEELREAGAAEVCESIGEPRKDRGSLARLAAPRPADRQGRAHRASGAAWRSLLGRLGSGIHERDRFVQSG